MNKKIRENNWNFLVNSRFFCNSPFHFNKYYHLLIREYIRWLTNIFCVFFFCFCRIVHLVVIYKYIDSLLKNKSILFFRNTFSLTKWVRGVVLFPAGVSRHTRNTLIVILWKVHVDIFIYIIRNIPGPFSWKPLYTG